MNALIQRRFIWGLVFLVGFLDSSLIVGSSEMFAGNILANIALYSHSLVHSQERIILLLSLPAFILGAVIVSLIENEQFEGAQPFLSISLLFASAGIAFKFFASGPYFQIAVLLTVCGTGMLHGALIRLQQGDQLLRVKDRNLKHIFQGMKNMLNPFHLLSSLRLVLFFVLGCLVGAVSTAHFGLSSLFLGSSILSIMSISLKIQIPAVFGENIIRLANHPKKEALNQDEKYQKE